MNSRKWPTILNASILKVIEEDLKFNETTPVQGVVLPIFVQQHKDVVVEAITGSGKTIAFVVPILEMLLKKSNNIKKHNIEALIISPTRELAQQIFDVIEVFLKELKQFNCILFVGGTQTAEDVNKFEKNGANIIVATAGRLEDLITRTKINFKNHFKSLEILILDEADRLLDLGFSESLNTILKYLPKQRRTGLFSATQTDELNQLIKAGLRNPCYIQVKQKGCDAQKTPVGLNNYFINVNFDDKFHQLVEFLKTKTQQKHIIFMSSCACVQYFSKILKHFLNENTNKDEVKVLALHRKLKGKRNEIFNEFKQLTKGILICTDILSRGIDIEDIDWVVQYDPPKTPSSFVHRCGRTARSGRVGNAIIFLLPNEDVYVNFILINQRVPLNEYDGQQNGSSYKETIKQIETLALKERELYEKGKEAFVSYIRAYSKHECSHLFQINFGKLAFGFGLLHMPKMPELKNVKIDFEPLLSDIDTSKIQFK
jgi:ATP-dependent RNA helicase DDX55/SPB4